MDVMTTVVAIVGIISTIVATLVGLSNLVDFVQKQREQKRPKSKQESLALLPTISSLPAQPALPPPNVYPQSERSNLPSDSTLFIGRTQEVASVQAILTRNEVRILTLTGPGGTGKTRLALKVAAKLVEEFRDGVFFVSLGRITDSSLVIPTIAQVLDVHESSDQTLIESLQSYLRDKQLLLLLDNFEHVLLSAPMVAELVASTRNLKVLVTSRAPLRIQGEREYVVPPLDFPDTQSPSDISTLSRYAAIRLFILRAQDVRADFEITNENASAVVEICVRLDGLPLAIELAAARTKFLTPQALLQRLTSRLNVLTSGARDLPMRQQTLRNTIEWSYRLLDQAEQTLFSRLAVFVGGCTLEAAESVCNAVGDTEIDTEINVLEGIESLLNKSLLVREDGPLGEPHFAMLETIREYALERLVESGEEAILRRQHAIYFLAFTQTFAPNPEKPDYTSRLERLEYDNANIRVALQWSIDHREAEMGVKFVKELWRFWIVRGLISEGRRWSEPILEKSQGLPPATRVSAVVGAGELARTQGDYAQAQVFHQEGLAIHQELGNKRGVASALHDLAAIAISQGDLQRARELSEESVRLRRELGEKAGIAHASGSFGEVLRLLGDYQQAREVLEECLAINREVGDQEGIYISLCNLGYIARHQQAYTQAIPLLKEGLELVSDVGDIQFIAYLLEEFAGVALGQGEIVRAARIWGAATSIREVGNCPLIPLELVGQERDILAARDLISNVDWETAWAEGHKMPLKQAIAYALEVTG